MSELIEESWSKSRKKREEEKDDEAVLKYDDIAAVIDQYERYLFLSDTIPVRITMGQWRREMQAAAKDGEGEGDAEETDDDEDDETSPAATK